MNRKGLGMPGVILLHPEKTPENDANLRRDAVVVAAQLPPDIKDALAVLDYARQIVVEFLAKKPGA